MTRFIPLLLICLFFNNAQGQTVMTRAEQQKLHLLKDSTSIVNSLNRIGLLYYMKNPDSCFYYGLKAKNIAIKLHYAKGEADANNVIAAAFVLKGLYRESLTLFNKALIGYKALADTENTAQALMNMAVVYANLMDSTRAKIFLRRAIQTGSKLRHDSIMNLVYINYCIYYNGLQDDSVKYYMHKSRKVAERYNDMPGLILVKEQQVSYLLNKKHKAEALPIIKDALAESRKAGLEYFELIALGLYGDYYDNKPDSLIHYYKLAYKVALANGYINVQIPILKQILENYKLLGDNDNIIVIQNELEKAHVAENKNLKKFVGDYVQYTDVQNNYQLLETKNQSNKTKIWLLAGICLIGTLLFIFVYRLYQLSYRSNRQMQKTLNDLEHSQADNTRMMQIVAHDLRNPIGGIYSIASIMLDNEERTEEDRMMLELIKTSGQNSLELVSSLLQIHTQAEQLKKEPVDLKVLLNYCTMLLRHKAEAKQQQLKLQAIQVTIPASREKLWRVLSNLIANAIKFSPNNTTIWVRLEKRKNMIVVAVEDQGIGIPETIKDKVFDMFTDAKRPGTAGEQPFGLGLAISKQIIEAHQGKLWFESNTDNGTTFFMELPV